MSSLRIETMRLCWLEAFIAVADAENISAAARDLAMDQSTVSRFLQALEKWLGKKLIEPDKIVDPANPGRTVVLTDNGREFYDVARKAIDNLQGFRSDEGKKDGLLTAARGMIDSMKADHNRNLIIYKLFKDKITIFDETMIGIDYGSSLVALKSFHSIVRFSFSQYEFSRIREMRVKRIRQSTKGISGAQIDMSRLTKPKAEEARCNLP